MATTSAGRHATHRGLLGEAMSCCPLLHLTWLCNSHTHDLVYTCRLELRSLRHSGIKVLERSVYCSASGHS